MIRYLKQYKLLLFLTVLFTAISSLSYVFIAILLQQVMDIVDMGDMDGFIRILLFSFCRCSAAAGRAVSRSRFQYQPGLYADDPDFRPDAWGLPGRVASDVLPGVLHFVLQERLPALCLPVFGGADSRRF